MTKNYFRAIRKSYVASTLVTTILSNIIVFGQPIEQMGFNRIKLSEVKLGKYFPAAIDEIGNETYSSSEASLETIPKKEHSKPIKKAKVFHAEQKEGIIGKKASAGADSPYDNFFGINIPSDVNLDEYEAVLTYDLFGLNRASYTTKSINGSLSYGGKIIQQDNEWKTVKERISVDGLKNGMNEIFFTRRVEENYQYEIKNLKIEFQEKADEILHLSENDIHNNNGKLYFSGYLKNKEVIEISVMDRTFKVEDGNFEVLLNEVPKNVREVEVKYATAGKSQAIKYAVNYNKNKTKELDSSNSLLRGKNQLTKQGDDILSAALGEAQVIINEKAETSSAGGVYIEGLGYKDVRPLGNDLVNVTAGEYEGYRIKKSNLKDSISLQLYLGFDPEKIPEGYTSKDVKTFYFDKKQKNWKLLSVDSLSYEKSQIITTIDNETDYINGVIKVPESPETGSFAPTAMSDIEFANPSAGVVAIQPPAPNNQGSANTSFPIKLPQGRNGMQPSLNVSYNSDGGNGWMGLGWNLSTPAVSLNTKWGAPLFGSHETELYSLNGEDLVLRLTQGSNTIYTSPHRHSGNIARNTPTNPKRHFFPRKEGSYNEIIRHGSNPTNYWWEVTDKQGNKNFYGGHPTSNGVVENTVLRTPSGNIGHWALYKSVDPHGNYIEYEYEKSTGNLSSTSIGTVSFYPKGIAYTRHNDLNAYYKVDFKRNNYTVSSDGDLNYQPREDILVNARNGYIQATKDLLTEIKISFYDGSQTRTIRTYRFDYKPSVFKKQQLERISEFDTNGELFYSNTMEYFDDITDENNEPEQIIQGSQIWSGDSEFIFSPLHQMTMGFSSFVVPMGSALGTTVSQGTSFGARVGVGIGVVANTVSNTLGGSLSYSGGWQQTRVSFVDINGDGLPDKVYSNDAGVSYSPNTGEGFGNRIQIDGINRLNRTKSKTNGSGFDANLFGLVSVGTSKSKTSIMTNDYFTDFNGDGLVDVLSGSSIRFNTTQGNNYLSRNFTGDIEASENEIEPGNLSPNIINEMELETELELQEQHPQFDHVKVWRAPYKGSIDITNNARLKQMNYDGTNSNTSFRLTVERPTEVAPILTASLSSVQTPFHNFSNVYPISVEKGDLIYFRIHNTGYGYGGQVEWNPVVTYTSTDAMMEILEEDENGKVIGKFDSEQDFILNNVTGWSPPYGANQVNINFNVNSQNFAALQFSDDIKFVIKRIEIDLTTGEEDLDGIFEVILNQNGTLNGDLQFTDVFNSTNSTSHRYAYELYVESDSNVQWDDIKWKPKFTANSEVYYPPVNYVIYDNNVNQKNYWFDGSDLPTPIFYPEINNDGENDFMTLSHDLFTLTNQGDLNSLSEDAFPIKINWVTKVEKNSITEILKKRTFYLFRDGSNNYAFSISADNFIPVSTLDETFNLTKNKVQEIIDASGKIYSAFYVNNERMGMGNTNAITLEIHPNQSSTWAPQEIQSAFMAVSTEFFGIPHRGWGEVLYNGGIKLNGQSVTDYGNSVIDPTVFDPESSGPVVDVDPNVAPEDIEAMDLAVRHTTYSQNNEIGKFENTVIKDAAYGWDSDDDLVVTVGRFALNNLYDDYIDPATIISGTSTGFFALQKRTISKGTAESVNVAMVEKTFSNSSSDILNEFIDVNGDRYPDLVSKGRIQYTNMRGALSEFEPSNNFVSGSVNEDESVGASLAGIKPKSDLKNQKYLENPMTNSDGSANQGDGTTYNTRQWMDMNGDGLLDKVKITNTQVRVQLNTGYSFTDPEEEIIWGEGGNLTVSSRNNTSFGLPLNVSTSFALGIGGAKSEANVQTTLFDVNGDGLPDLVVNGNYFLNTGVSFETVPETFYNSSIDKNVSVTGTSYVALTKGHIWPTPTIPSIPIKFVASPSVNGNAAFDERKITVQDINGDGLADVLEKDSGSGNASVVAHLNQVGRTHLLRKVNTPLGGSWVINYEREGNTYDMPQSKWVLNEIKTHDGFEGDNNLSFDETLTGITYSSPKHDRREREFYGFGNLVVRQKYPGGQEYRRTVKIYHNDNYYLQGAEKSVTSWQGNEQLSSKETRYLLLDPTVPQFNLETMDDNEFLQDGLDIDLLDHSRLFVAVARVKSKNFENGQSLTSKKDFLQYDDYGNLEEYIDYGEGEEDAYKTTIHYFNSSSFTGIDNATGYPEKIEVSPKNQPTQLLRKREATYYPSNGNLKQITTTLNAFDFNKVSFKYDVYGNVDRINQLDNLNESGSYYYQEVEYDPMIRTYPTYFENAFDQTSATAYNYLFGVPIFTRDMNWNEMRTRIDDRGRIVEVTGPNELALEVSGEHAWTIRMEYEGENPVDSSISQLNSADYMINAQASFEAAELDPQTGEAEAVIDAQHHAITRHFDPAYANGTIQSSNELTTISIVDGFGQAIQLKKTLVSGANNTLKWQVSGKEKKDPFGRVIKKYLPTTEQYTSIDYLEYDDTFDNNLLQETIAYDTKDRPVNVFKADEQQQSTSINYGIEGDLFVLTVTNELDQVSKSYTDVRGRKRKTVNVDIETHFDYNAINELVSVTNHNGYVTNNSYDLAGRLIETQHPDRGVTLFTYDNAGNLKVRKDSNMLLAETPGEINYSYNFGRLDEITYPFTPENNVKYTYGEPLDDLAEAENAVGRLLMQEDGSGVQVFGYGKMGELTKNLRSVTVAGKHSYWFLTQWQYDSWNRLMRIIYPDQEIITYNYNLGGELSSISSNSFGVAANQDVVTAITYTNFGERERIEYGNGTVTEYEYDNRRRMNFISHAFEPNAQQPFIVQKSYIYDLLSNVEMISSSSNLPGLGQLGGPSNYTYTYDNYNRLVHAEGNYVGPNDILDTNNPTYLRQEYVLDMVYDDSHSILSKVQTHTQGVVAGINDPIADPQAVNKTSYKLAYDDYATGAYVAGSNYGYQQPHAPRSIEERPIGQVTSEEDPRIRRKSIEYDANGNQLEIIETIGELDISLRKNLWDEENRLKGVDLNPEATRRHPIAAYAYDAGGERIVKYNLNRLDVHSNANKVGEEEEDNIMIYPSGLVTGKPIESEEGVMTYFKHYYIGSERISSKRGTLKELGLYPEKFLSNYMPDLGSEPLRSTSDQQVQDAGSYLQGVYTAFELQLLLPSFSREGNLLMPRHDPEGFGIYYFHPDHLGSSNYITNLDGTVSQHMEYMAFGETLVEEHLNSNNSPYKFNAKELDEETGNYYYGARYYDPKFSIWLSVDPLAEEFPEWSSYNYTLQNPIIFTDPDGKAPEGCCDDLPEPLNRFFTALERNVGPAVEKYGRMTGEFIASVHPAVAVQNIYKGATEGEDVFGNKVSNTDIGLEVAGILPIFKLGKAFKFLKFADEGGDVVKGISRTIQQGGKKLDDLIANIDGFDDIRALANDKGGKKKIKEFVEAGDSKTANKIFESLKEKGYKAEAIKNGYKLNKGDESFIFRSSNSGGGKDLDTFTKNVNGKQVDVFFGVDQKKIN